MSGGRLVVLERSGRESNKQYALESGVVKLGASPGCDIRVLLPSVRPHHATVSVHASQTIVRNVSDGETKVNDVAVSVAALRHGDVITLGERSLRWYYSNPDVQRPLSPQPALYKDTRRSRSRRRETLAAPAPARPRSLQVTLEMTHRASAPASAGGKQVAIVQPQRRDNTETTDTIMRSSSNSPRSPTQRPRSQPESPQLDLSSASIESEDRGRKSSSTPRITPKTLSLHNTTKASMWIESRKSTPRQAKSPQKTPQNMKTPQTAKSPQTVKTPHVVITQLDANSTQMTRTPQAGKSETPRTTSPLAVSSPPPQEARKLPRRAASARKSTPLRLAVLRKVQSAKQLVKKRTITKIEAPNKIDHMKQVAINLMTGHTKSRRSSPTGPSFVVKKPSPQARPSLASKSPKTKSPQSKNSMTPTASNSKRVSVASVANSTRRSSRRTTAGQSVSVLEITDTDSQNSTLQGSRSITQSQSSLLVSPCLPSPKKSSMKDPTVKSMRKSESIKFDFSNLENLREDESEMLTATNSSKSQFQTPSEDELTLRYSDSSTPSPPSSRRSIHSRTSKMLAAVDSPVKEIQVSLQKILTPNVPSGRKSLRGSLILQKALGTSRVSDNSRYSRRTTKTVSDQSWDTTTASAFRTRTLSPRSSKHIESYSVVDLVSVDSNELNSVSLYDSVGSTRSSSIIFGTPQTSIGRRTRSTIEPNILSSSTPYVGRARASNRSHSSTGAVLSKNSPDNSTRSTGFKRSKSLSTPENTEKHISINSTKLSRASRSRSRLNDSDLQLISAGAADADESPKSSRSFRANQIQNESNITIPSPTYSTLSVRSPTNSTIVTNASPRNSSRNHSNKSSPASKRNSPRKNITVGTSIANISQDDGTITPENRHSPEEVGTPVLSIQHMLDSSRSSLSSYQSPNTRTSNSRRKTIGVIRNKEGRTSLRSKSFTAAMKKSLRSLGLRESPKTANKTADISQNDGDIVTPKSSVKLVPEAVKNRHSTAKKPQSKRSFIDSLNDSAIVKQLFNSPVKRKLSQSMTEFSRKQLFDDEAPKRPTRNTIALTGRSANNSMREETPQITPETFVSPLSTPGNSPNLSGVTRLFRNSTQNNDSRNVKGVKGRLRTPKSVKNDLRNVSGVKSLFQSKKKQKSPTNDLTDVRGVRSLFTRKSPTNDLRNVSGVKKTLRKHSPRNDLADVRGVRRMFREEKQREDYSDVSGVEELFNESAASRTDAESLFDQLIGKPPIKAVYSKSAVLKNAPKRKAKPPESLHQSIEVITNNVEQWLEEELKKRLHKDDKSKVSKELQKLAIDTVEGNELRASRIRNSTVQKSSTHVSGNNKNASERYSAHTLPIKKRSVVEASLEKSQNKSNKLPIKKRAVVHSTPMKGRYDLTMNASELGRVSPIPAVDKTHSLENQTVIQQTKESTRKGKRLIPIVLQEVEIEYEPPNSPVKDRSTVINTKSSPKIKRAAKAKAEVGLQATLKAKPTRVTRTRRDTDNNTQKSKLAKSKTNNKSTNVADQSDKEKSQEKISKPTRSARRANAESTSEINKESDKALAETQSQPTTRPVTNTEKSAPAKKSPKGKQLKSKSVVENKPSPKKTRGKAGQSLVKTRSRKNNVEDTTDSNAKKRRTSLAITKKPPVLSPQSAKGTAQRKEKDVSSKVQSPKRLPTRSRRNKVEDTTVSNATKRRTSLVITKKPPVLSPKSPKGTTQRKEKDVSSEEQSPKRLPTRSRKNKVEDNTVSNAKKRRTSLVITKKPPVLNPQSPKRTTRRKEDVSSKVQSPKRLPTRKQARTKVETPKPLKKTRGKLVVSKPSPQLKPQTSTAQNKREPPKKPQEATKRGRRNVEDIEPERAPKTKQQAKTRGGNISEKVVLKSPLKIKPTPKTRGGKVQKPASLQKRTRQVESDQEPASKRSRTTANKSEVSKAVETLPKRGRNTKVNEANTVEIVPKRGRNAKNNDTVNTEPVKTQRSAKKTAPEDGSQTELARTSRRTKTVETQNKETVAALPRGRKRKAADDIQDVPPKVSKNNEAKPTRGRKAVAEVTKVETAKGRPKPSSAESKAAKVTTTNKVAKKIESEGKKEAKALGAGKSAAAGNATRTTRRKAASPVKQILARASPVKGKATNTRSRRR